MITREDLEAFEEYNDKQYEFDFRGDDLANDIYQEMEEQFTRDNYMFMEYQTQVKKLISAPSMVPLIEYSLGLLNEPTTKEDAAEGIGHVLLGMTFLAIHYQLDLSEIALDNIEKLQERKERESLKGSKDV